MKTNFNYLLIAVIALAFYSCADSKKEKSDSGGGEFTIKGQIPVGFEMDSVFLYNDEQKAVFAAPVKDGKFTLKGAVEQPVKYILGNEKTQLRAPIIVEKDNFEFTMDSAFFQIKGGKNQQIVLGHINDPKYIDLVKKYNHIMNVEFEKIDMQNEEAVTKARALADAASDKVTAYDDSVSNSIITGNYPTITKMFALISSQDWKNYPPEKCYQLLDTYEKEIGPHPNLTAYRKYLKQAEDIEKNKKNITNGMPAQEVIATGRDGKAIMLSGIMSKNKYTLLEFWASWCSPCRGEIPNLKKAYAKFHSKGLEIFSVSLDDNRDKWIKALDEEKTTWINGVDLKAFEAQAAKEYGLQGIPASFLIDQNGVIIANNDELREFNLDRTLTKLIK